MSCPQVIEVITPGPPGPALQLTGPALAGRISGTGALQSIGLGAGLSIVDGALTITSSPGSGTVTSVGLSVPTGFSVAGSPITGSGTLALSFAAGYSLPSDDLQEGWTTGAALAATAIQPGNAALTDAREWTAATVSQEEAQAGTGTTRRAFTAQRVFQAIAAWWAASSAKAKLDGIASGATANSTDAELRDRLTHTGTQAASTITGLSSVATSGAYGDLSGRPTLGTAAAANTEDFATAAQGSLAQTAVQPGALAAVATSGAYSDLSGKPTVPGLSDATPQAPGAAAPGTATSAARADHVHPLPGLFATPVYATNNYIIPVPGYLAPGAAVNVNTIYLTPFTVLRNIRISELGARVTTQLASSTFQLAIYASAGGLPTGDPLGATADLSGATATVLSASVTPFDLFTDQLYWMALNSAGSSNTLVFQTGSSFNSYANSVLGAETLIVVSNAASGVAWNRTFNQTYNTWPNLTGQTTGLATGARCPAIILRVGALL